MLDGGLDPSGEGAVMGGHLLAHCKVYGICGVSPAKTNEQIESHLGYGLMRPQGTMY